MKKLVFLLLFLLCLCAVLGEETDKSTLIIDDIPSNDSQVYVVLEKPAVPKLQLARAKELASDQIQEIIGEENVHAVFPDVIAAELNETEIAELENNSLVKEIIPVPLYQPFLTESVGVINASLTWNHTYNNQQLTGKGQSVCIIDTGVNFSHPDLGGCFGAGCKVIAGYDTQYDVVDPRDFEGHGTHVAGIVAANGTLKGVAPGANIVAVAAYDYSANGGQGGFQGDALAEAIYWCVHNATKYNISVISMSLGGGQYTTYCDDVVLGPAIDAATAQNISVVVATGNTNVYYPSATAGIASPSCFRNVTRVTATTKQDIFASYAFRHQNFPDILTAPGSDINSLNFEGGYIVESGTSMATPHVAGALAIINQLLKLKNTSKTPQELRQLLNTTGKPIYDSSTGISYSRINIMDSISGLDDILIPTISLISPLVSVTNNESVKINATINGTGTELSNVTFFDGNSTLSSYNQTTIRTYCYNTTSSWQVIECNITANLSEGIHSLQVYAKDSGGLGNEITLNRTITVDVSGPKIDNFISSPQIINENNSYNFVADFYDASNISTVQFFLNGTLNQTIFVNATSYEFSLQPSISNSTTYYFIINDSFNTTRTTQTYNFTIINITNTTLLANQSQQVPENISEIILPAFAPSQNLSAVHNASVILNLSYASNVSNATIVHSLNLTRLDTRNITISFAENTTMTGSENWTLTVQFPQRTSTSNFTAPSGSLNDVIFVGSNESLNLSNPAKITLQGLAGKRAAWSNSAGTLTDISTQCNNSTLPTNLNTTTRECYGSEGSDLVIWTSHLSYFSAYTLPSSGGSSGGGGGGGGGGGAPAAVNISKGITVSVPAKAEYFSTPTQLTVKNFSITGISAKGNDKVLLAIKQVPASQSNALQAFSLATNSSFSEILLEFSLPEGNWSLVNGPEVIDVKYNRTVGKTAYYTAVVSTLGTFEIVPQVIIVPPETYVPSNSTTTETVNASTGPESGGEIELSTTIWFAGAILLILAIVLTIVYFGHRNRPNVDTRYLPELPGGSLSAEVHERIASSAIRDVESLSQYVKKELKKNIPPKRVKEALLKAGWPEEEVMVALKINKK